MERFDAFLSYAGRDRDLAGLIRSQLTDAGFGVFLDTESIDSGQNILGSISAALDRSRCLLLVVTPEAMDSDWVQLELEDFQAAKRRVLLRHEWAPVPRCERFEEIDFERGQLSSEAFTRKYRRSFRSLCRLLNKGRDVKCSVPVRVDSPADATDRLPRYLRTQLVKALHELVKHDNVRRAVCVALELPIDFDEKLMREPTRKYPDLVANRILVEVTRRYSPWRGGYRLIELLLHFNLDSSVRRSLNRYQVEIKPRIAPDIDSGFVESVKEALGRRYEVQNVLGGTSTISLRAVDQTLQRPVVIKVLRPPAGSILGGGSGTDEEAEQHATATRTFRDLTRHAARSRFRDFGQIYGSRFDDPVLLYVREYFDGLSLPNLMRVGGDLSAGAIADICTRLWEILVPIEQAGFVHLDVTPRNVLVGEDGEVRMSPYGILHPATATAEILDYFRSRYSWSVVPPEMKKGGRAKLSGKLMQFALGKIVLDFLLGLGTFRRLHEAPDSQFDWPAIESEFRDRWIVPGSVGGGSGLCALLCELMSVDPAGRPDSIEDAGGSLTEMLRKLKRRNRRSDSLSSVFGKSQDIERRRAERQEVVADSLARALGADLVSVFYEKLWASPRIRSVFERVDQERVARGLKPRDEVTHKKNLEFALRTLARYGCNVGYRPIGLERVAKTHGAKGYAIAPESYPPFNEILLQALKECDPFIKTSETGALRGVRSKEIFDSWERTMVRAVEYIQQDSVERSEVPGASQEDLAKELDVEGQA